MVIPAFRLGENTFGFIFKPNLDKGTWCTSDNTGWALEDSNLRPQPCEGCALTN